MRLSALSLSVLAFAAATLSLTRPASATISNITLTATQSQGLTCPYSLHVTGTATGTAGQAFQVSIQSYFNGTQGVVLPPTAAAMSANGTASQVFDVPVPVLTGTGNYVRLVVAPPVGAPLTQTLPISCVAPPSAITVSVPDSDHLTCPNVITVSSEIDGAPGVAYQWTPQSFAGGTQRNLTNGSGAAVPGGAFTMPASGKQIVTFPMDIDGQLPSASSVVVVANAAALPSSTKQTKLALGCGSATLSDFTVYNAPSGGAWRPKDTIHYAYETLKVGLRVLQPSAPSSKIAFTVGSCGYHVTFVNREGTVISNGAPLGSPRIETDGGKSYYVNDVDIGYPRDSGVYHLVAVPKEIDAHDGTTECTGKVDQQLVIYPQTAWIVGFQLRGNGYHIGMASDSPVGSTWCSSCDSIFSPAHNTALLYFVPDVKGATYFPPGKGSPYQDACAYDVAFYGSKFSGNNDWNIGTPTEMLYKNGQAFTVNGNTKNPYVSQWDGDSNTVQVVVKAADDSKNPVLNCNILGGDQLSGSITFTDQNGFSRGNKIGE